MTTNSEPFASPRASTEARAPRGWVFLILFFFSGASGLIYELVWTRRLILIMGGTTFAITTVLVAFMSGLALGSYLGGRMESRATAPGRMYGMLEITIGIYCLFVPSLFQAAEPIYRALYQALPASFFFLSLTRFAVSALVLLVPTTCMGATLPLLVRQFTRHDREIGLRVALYYAVNTFGAFVGTVAGGFFLLPLLGLNRSTQLAALVNLVIGAVALKMSRPAARRGTTPVSTSEIATEHRRQPRVETASPWLRRLVLSSFGISGFTAMVYQITWTRALVMSIGSSVYAFTSILATFIFGIALGSMVIARWADSLRRPVFSMALMEGGIALGALLVCPAFGRMPELITAVLKRYAASYGAVVALEFLIVFAVVLIPTAFMGAIFPAVSRICAKRANQAGATAGTAYAVNTIGTILGSFCAGFLMIANPRLGIQNSIFIAAGLNALVGVILLLSDPQGRFSSRLVWAGALAVVTCAAVTSIGRWNRTALTAGAFLNRQQKVEGILYYREGIDATVSVTQNRYFRSLRVNSKPDASTEPEDMITQILTGHLPVLLAPKNDNVLLIGLGSGVSLGAITRHSTVRKIDCAEISQAVIEATRYFRFFNHEPQTDPRVSIVRTDGRNHLLLTNNEYDVIISEPSNPWISGVSNLFTEDFFRLCRKRLAPDGILCQWVNGYSFSLDDFRMVIRSLREVFPFVTVWGMARNDYLLVAGKHPYRLDLGELRGRLQEPEVAQSLSLVAMERPASLLANFWTDADHFQLSAKGPINTDDNSALEFSAPRSIYLREGDRILGELARMKADPAEVLLSYDEHDPEQRTILSRAETIRSYRAKIPRLTQLTEERRISEALALAKEMRAAIPDDVEVYRYVAALLEYQFQMSRRKGDDVTANRLAGELREVKPPPWYGELVRHGGGTQTD